MGAALLPVGADAQATGAPSAADVAALKQQLRMQKCRADNAWMLVSSALVLMMTGPGPGALLRRPGAQEERAGAR